jgi:D-alanine-D-alanine ligase
MKKDKNQKIHIVLLFGGKSAEHEVSIRSAQSIYNVLNKDKYEITLIGIDKNGTWLSLNAQQFLSSKEILFDKQITPYNINNLFQPVKSKVDVVFPVLHGPFGEDGTIQGLLKLASVPFVGAGVLGSSVGMDKDVAKRLLRDAGLPNVRFHIYNEYERKTITFEKVRKDLGLPLFVKPANLGSSVGIAKAHNKTEFIKAINSAFQYDSKILIEEYIKGREIECSVLGNEKPIASVCGEIIPHHEFYSYEAKYLDDNGAVLSIPAKIPKPIMSKIQILAVKAFKVLCCEGMARVDFFLKENGEIYINEINTIPGFTSISMYPKLWEESDISYGKLIDSLIKLAIDRHNKEQKLKTSLK